MNRVNTKLFTGFFRAAVFRAAVFAAAALLGCVTVQACGAKNEPHAVSTVSVDVSIDDVLSQKTINRDITLGFGDTLKLSLGSNHTTPFHWRVAAKIGDPSVVRQLGHNYEEPSDTGGKVGVPGTEVYTFKARKTGKTTIATDYVASNDATPECSFTANVTVQ